MNVETINTGIMLDFYFILEARQIKFGVILNIKLKNSS